MTTIYTVEGSTGEYSDRYNWVVYGFFSLEKAQDYLNKIEETYKSFDQNKPGFYRSSIEQRDLKAAMEPLDPSFCEDYTGTFYHISELEIYDG